MTTLPATSHGQEVKPYVYTPVTKKQIRVLVLHPASQESHQLRGELLVVDLDDLPPRQKPYSSETIDPAKHVCFEAISYVWGQGTFTDTLVTPDGFIRITASLASILRRLRDHSRPRTYWVDGVCINQADADEKGIQVPLMGLIYSSAVRVLCDICQDEKFEPLLDAMDRYWRRNIRRGVILASAIVALSKESSAEIMGVTLPTQEEADAIEEDMMEDWSKAFLELVQLKWFHRLWIMQEFVLGRDVSMVFGRQHIPWRQLWAGTVQYQGVGIPWDGIEFVKAENVSMVTSLTSICFIRACRTIDPNTAHGREFKQVVDILMGGTDLNEAQLTMCIMAGCYKQCTIPQDRYYGILGLVEGGEELHADYTAPMRGITIQFWKRALQLASGGELILLAGMAGQTSGYPSWLRDISLPDPLSHLWQFGPLLNSRHRAGGGLGTWSARFSDSQPDEMITQGYFIDEITEISSDEPTEPFRIEAMAIRFENAMSFFTSEPQAIRYPLTGESIQDAAVKAACLFSQSLKPTRIEVQK
ncbi:heterokaryon incompatibility protein or allele [Fusarium flagelliforme]|uniref:Heterokaryon incompatibility protein or allele n=1 Tax=Fusarium flagelliforme TaxID=2675880 RepID=A0A395N2T1_9HYPO|nr:heterokaryon incompatibility protein or allele [Fusarium flagelliforme]